MSFLCDVKQQLYAKCLVWALGWTRKKLFSISYMLNSKNGVFKVRKRAKIRNRYNQAPHLTQDTNGKVTSQLDITNESQEVSPFPAGDHKASINRRTRKHNRNKTDITQMIHKRNTALERLQPIFLIGTYPMRKALLWIIQGLNLLSFS